MPHKYLRLFRKSNTKRAEVTGDFIGNQSVEKVVALSRLNLESEEISIKAPKERYISPEKKSNEVGLI